METHTHIHACVCMHTHKDPEGEIHIYYGKVFRLYVRLWTVISDWHIVENKQR